MNHDTAVSRAKEIATEVLAPAAAQNDKEARFSSAAVAALGEHGLLGMLVPTSIGGAGLGPRAFAEVTATLAEGDPSAAMVFLMHSVGAATIAAAPATAPVRRTLEEIAAGKHLTTLAFSEAGSRSHFWAPVSRARRNGHSVLVSAKKSWVTSAAHAQSYVVSTQRPEATQPTDSTLYLLPAGTPGLRVSGPWDGMGLRANASAPMVLETHRVPIDAVRSDRDFRHQIRVRKSDPIFGEAAQGHATNDPVLVRNATGVEEGAETLPVCVARHGRREAHAEALGARRLDAAPGALPGAGAAVLVVEGGRRAVDADLQRDALPRQ